MGPPDLQVDFTDILVEFGDERLVFVPLLAPDNDLGVKGLEKLLVASNR